MILDVLIVGLPVVMMTPCCARRLRMVLWSLLTIWMPQLMFRSSSFLRTVLRKLSGDSWLLRLPVLLGRREVFSAKNLRSVRRLSSFATASSRRLERPMVPRPFRVWRTPRLPPARMIVVATWRGLWTVVEVHLRPIGFRAGFEVSVEGFAVAQMRRMHQLLSRRRGFRLS